MFNGQVYRAGNRMQLEYGRSLFKALALNDKMVMDCGCGDGRATVEFLDGQTVKGVLAFDPSPSQIEVAREACKKEGWNFFVAGFENFLDVDCGQPVQGEVDVAISNFALHLAKSRASAFSNIFAALKPGGEFHAIYPTHCSFLSRMLRELEHDDRFGQYISQIPIHEKNPNGVALGNEDTEQYPTHLVCTYKLLLAAGFSFSNLRVTERISVTAFENEDEVVRFVAGINIHRTLVPEELRADFDKAAAFELRKTPYFFGPDRLLLASPCIEIHAYKEGKKATVDRTDASEESFHE